jgi:hypothetical protein
LVKRIGEIANARGEAAVYVEGGKHTKVTVGDRAAVIPRHSEIKEPLAKRIIADLEGK